jgi:Late exocytosis, associated with Golgi transport
MEDEKFAACSGFDALAYARAIKLLMLMSLYVAITVCVIVLPVNTTASYVQQLVAEQNSPLYAACDKDKAPSEDPEDKIAVRRRRRRRRSRARVAALAWSRHRVG